jgi:hypothetical protein
MIAVTPNNRNHNHHHNSDDVEVGESTPLLLHPAGDNNNNNNNNVPNDNGNVPNDNDNDDNNANDPNEPPPLQEMKVESLKERAVAVTAGVSFLSSLAALIFEAAAHPVVWVSGVLGAVLAPYAALQQQKLTQVEALHQTNRRMEQEVQQLEAENVRLSQQVREMEESVIK